MNLQIKKILNSKYKLTRRPSTLQESGKPFRTTSACGIKGGGGSIIQIVLLYRNLVFALKEVIIVIYKKMTLYARCIQEITKPELLELYRSELKLLPAQTKCEILSVLSKSGFFKDATILRQLVNLTLVAIDFGDCVVNDDMLSCLHGCTYLRQLDLRLRRKQPRNITTDGLLRLLPHITFLEILDIPECKEFTDQVTEKLCECCLNLKQLYIQSSSITNHSLFLIGQYLTAMSVLNILGTNVNDKGIELLVKGPLFKSLTEVNMDKCPNVTPIASATLAEKCRNVKIFTSNTRAKGTLCFAFRGFIPIKKEVGQVVWKM